MESRVFESFGEAAAFAKDLARQEVDHNLKRSGSSWIVEHEKLGRRNSPQDADIEELRKQIDEKDLEIDRLIEQSKREREDYLAKIQKLEERQTDLKHKLEALQSHIENEVARRTEEEKGKLEKASSEVAIQADSLVAEKRKLGLLEKAYEENFGAAEIKTVKETITSKEVCPMCNGDGGVRGGCEKCDGTGWIDVTKERSKEVVEFNE